MGTMAVGVVFPQDVEIFCEKIRAGKDAQVGTGRFHSDRLTDLGYDCRIGDYI